LVYNSARNLAVKLYSNYQMGLEARACDIVKERTVRRGSCDCKFETLNLKLQT
jgi:hypothetical protein